MMTVAAGLVLFCKAWLVAGALVGLWFVVFVVGCIDAAAKGAYAFRPLLLPCVALLWPLVLFRSVRLLRRRPPRHH